MLSWARPLPLPPLKTGIGHAYAVRALQDLLPGLALVMSPGGDWSEIENCRDRYLSWTESAEIQLRATFSGTASIDGLLTSRYWHIRSMGPNTPRPYPLIQREVEVQRALIEDWLLQLRHEQEVFALEKDELAVVLDTNVHLHCVQFQDIPWEKVTRHRKVRIVIPMPVLDELDEKTYHRDEDVRRAAKSTIRYLHRIRGDRPPEDPLELPGKPRIRVQILLDPPGHRRIPNMDDEILARAEHLQGAVGAPLRVVARDAGVHTRAVARGLRTWWPDPEYSRREEERPPLEPS